MLFLDGLAPKNWLSAGICKSGDLTGFSEIRHFG
jgi:hypothetical protein